MQEHGETLSHDHLLCLIPLFLDNYLTLGLIDYFLTLEVVISDIFVCIVCYYFHAVIFCEAELFAFITLPVSRLTM